MRKVDLDVAGNSSKRERYEVLYASMKALLESERDVIANMANVAAVLKEHFGFFWVGFYLVKDNELVLGPFQGPVACTRIAFGKGVCGTAWKERRTVVVPDVEAFPGYIACSALSRSEVVIPIMHKEEVIAVLDIDSDQLDFFDESDVFYLEKMVSLLNF